MVPRQPYCRDECVDLGSIGREGVPADHYVKSQLGVEFDLRLARLHLDGIMRTSLGNEQKH